jgi:membrane-associated HD superfamily phosphohydrolase
MKLFMPLYDVTSAKYATYYSIILVIISGIAVASILRIIVLPTLECLALIFEGFVSVYMLSRHKETRATLIKVLQRR